MNKNSELQKDFVEKNVEAISEAIVLLAENCLHQVTNSNVCIKKSSKRILSEGTQLKKQLAALLKTLEQNVMFIPNEPPLIF